MIKALRGIDLVESVSHARHVHGGDAAKIYSMAINVAVKNRRPHTLAVAKLELLRGHCRTTAWESRTPLTVTGYDISDWDTGAPLAKGTTSVRIPRKPGLYQIRVAFDGVEAYQACDRFAFAATLVIDRATVDVELPLHVTRFEPLRDQP